MLDAHQINRVFRQALATGDDLLFMAAKVACDNAVKYGPLTPEQVEAIKQSWGE